MIKSIMSYIKERQTLFTVLITVSILLGGVVATDNPQLWWIIPVMIAGFIAIALIFRFTMSIVKFALSIVVLSFTILLSVFIGEFVFYDFPFASMFWAVSTFFVFAFCMCVSYIVSSIYSRWNVLSITVFLHFVIVTILGAFLDINLAIILGTALAVAVFGAIYYLPLRFASRHKKMPSNIASDELMNSIKQAFTEQGWGFVDARHKGNQGGCIVFKESAFYIYPITMKEEFKNSTKKRPQLAHAGKPISRWVLAIRAKISLRHKAYPILPVLLDLYNLNGSQGKAISVSQVDSSGKNGIPCGIFPGKDMNSTRKDKSIIVDNFEHRFHNLVPKLSDKQKKYFTGLSDRQKEREQSEGVSSGSQK